MNRILLVLLLLVAAQSGKAQTISVASFKSLPNDLDARVNFPIKDQNGDVCAIIKVVTTQTGFNWDGDQLGISKVEKKTGEYWLYVPWGTKRLTIKHDKLGVLRDYNYPESIMKATVYEMILTTGNVRTTIEEELTTTWLTVTGNPEGADVYINDGLKGITPLPVKLTPGKYTYRIEKPMYYTTAGSIEITGKEPDGKKELTFDLKPAFGNIQIFTLPEDGVTVLINDIEASGKTPFTGEKLKSGKHKITVKKDMYQPKSIELTVIEGETTRDIISLSPNFANINITTQPEAEIYIDGKQIANGTYKGRVLAGVHTFEAMRDSHNPDRKDKEIVAGEDITLNLTVQPIFGNIDVVSNPIGATVYLNGIEKGTTPITLKNLLIGSCNIKIEKRGYEDLTKSIIISKGKTAEISEKLISKKVTSVNPPIDKPTVKPLFSADYYKYKKRKNFWFVSTLVTGAAGAYTYLGAEKYYTQYQTATTDADALQKKVELFDMISPIAFGIAGLCAIEFIVKASKQGKAKKQSISLSPQPINHGAGFGLVYTF